MKVAMAATRQAEDARKVHAEKWFGEPLNNFRGRVIVFYKPELHDKNAGQITESKDELNKRGGHSDNMAGLLGNKMTEIAKLLDKSANKPVPSTNPRLYINHLSGSWVSIMKGLTGSSDPNKVAGKGPKCVSVGGAHCGSKAMDTNMGTDASGVSKWPGTNHQFVQILRNGHNGNLRVSSMDFPGPAIISAIVSQNFRPGPNNCCGPKQKWFGEIDMTPLKITIDKLDERASMKALPPSGQRIGRFANQPSRQAIRRTEYKETTV